VEARHAWERRIADPFESPVYLQGIVTSGTTDMYHDPAKRLHETLNRLALRAEAWNDDTVFRPLCVNAYLHGVHFVDKVFGAEVYELDGEEENWQNHYLDTPVGELTRPDLDSNPTWTAAKRFAEAFVDSGVTVPVLMLPTIASALNGGLNLYGQKLLLAMMIDPVSARHDLEVINGVLIEMHDWYRSNVPEDLLRQVCCGSRYQPPGCGQICGCSTQLVSQDQYRTFVADLDEAVLSRYPNGGMIHLCGAHTQHIPIWRDMNSLRAIQVNDRAAEDLEIYLAQMPNKVYYVNPCDGMPLARVEALAKDHKIIIVDERALGL